MAQPQENVAELFNVATIRGRIDSSRFADGKHYTTVTTPARDAYSHPSTLEIGSKQSLGAKGQDLTVGVSIGGSSRTNQWTDSVTGEQKKGTFYRVHLNAIED